MAIFTTRPLRVGTECTVEIRLQERRTGSYLPGVCPGLLMDISQKGACVVVPKMLLEGKHLFFTTLNSDRYQLIIHIEKPIESVESFTVSAFSIWMDSFLSEGKAAFKVGVCFHEIQKELFQFFKERG